MPKRPSKDANEPAAGEPAPGPVPQSPAPAAPHPPVPGKNPAAVALGRLGGLKGGKARAKNLSAKRRKQIAAAAARARWKS